MQNGNFYEAFVAGAIGSLVADRWNKIAGNFAKSSMSGGTGSYLSYK